MRKLRPPGGLQFLCIFDVTHEQNLNDLKHGFLKKGGHFAVADSKTGFTLTQDIVSHTRVSVLYQREFEIFFRGTGCRLCID